MLTMVMLMIVFLTPLVDDAGDEEEDEDDAAL